jgi:drug/metabolite transporter (DMT)-like permease
MLYGELSAFCAAVLWSFSSLVFTSAAQRLGSLMLNITRMALASVFLIITLAIIGESHLPSLSQIFWLSVSGFVGLVLGDTFLFKAYTILGPRVSSLVMASNPAMAAILAFMFFGESIAPLGILGMALTLGGISLVVGEKKAQDQSKFTINKMGIIYAIGAALGQASGLIFAKIALAEAPIHPLSATLIRIFTSVLMLIPIMLVLKKMKNPVKIFAEDKKSLGLVFIGSIIGPYLGIALSFIAISYAKVGIASSLMSTTPLLILPLAKFVYKEKISRRAIVGAFIGVAGVIVLFMK